MPGIYELLIQSCGWGLDTTLTAHHTDNLTAWRIPLPVWFLLTLSPLFWGFFLARLLIVKWFSFCCCLSQPLGGRFWNGFTSVCPDLSVTPHAAPGGCCASRLYSSFQFDTVRVLWSYFHPALPLFNCVYFLKQHWKGKSISPARCWKRKKEKKNIPYALTILPPSFLFNMHS